MNSLTFHGCNHHRHEWRRSSNLVSLVLVAFENVLQYFVAVGVKSSVCLSRTKLNTDELSIDILYHDAGGDSRLDVLLDQTLDETSSEGAKALYKRSCIESRMNTLR